MFTVKTDQVLQPLRSFLLPILLLPLVSASAADTPDYEREQRIAEQIEPQVFDGETIWLQANDREFLSIYTSADNPRGAVLLLHGRDVNPEDLNVIGPMRVGLVESDWSTLALQMPVLEKGHKYYDYLPILRFSHARIEAGVAYLREQGYDTVILAGHSCGAHMANDWLNTVGGESINGYIAMGSGATDHGQELKTPFPFAGLSIPVLDIYGSEEFPRPLSMVPMRLELLQQGGNPHSAQKIVQGADHYFHDHGDALTEMVADWLASSAF